MDVGELLWELGPAVHRADRKPLRSLTSGMNLAQDTASGFFGD